MLKEIRLKYTAYGDLKDGDEFIRVGALPVLLKDVEGKREGNVFTPIGFGRGYPFSICRMVAVTPDYLREIDLNDKDDYEL